jgi:hypothetical protein
MRRTRVPPCFLVVTGCIFAVALLLALAMRDFGLRVGANLPIDGTLRVADDETAFFLFFFDRGIIDQDQ